MRIRPASVACSARFGDESRTAFFRHVFRHTETVMAHTKQARKRIRQTEDRRLHNKTVKGDLRTAIKKYHVSLKTEGADVAAAMASVESKLDKAAKRRVIPAGRADRLKGRLKRLATAKG